LACAVGDHLPIELVLRVQALEAERALLAGGVSAAGLSSASELG
jgi:hypothetical protein